MMETTPTVGIHNTNAIVSFQQETRITIVQIDNTEECPSVGHKCNIGPGITSERLIIITEECQECEQQLLNKPQGFKNYFIQTDYKMTNKLKRQNSGSTVNIQEISTRRAVFIVGSIFVFSLAALCYVYTNFPDLDPSEKQFMKIPLHIEDAKNLGKVLERYKDLYYFEVLAGLFITYIFLQTFAIPGSIFLSILSGFLFSFPLALLLVCTCSAIGASLCYLLSSLVGRKLLFKYFPEKANQWSLTITKHKDNLLNYMIFLRVTPLLPNWFINLASPVIGVPMMPFSVGTFIGVAPPSFVAIQAGQTLNKLTSSSDAWSWNSIIILFLFALLSLVPVLFKKNLRHKFD